MYVLYFIFHPLHIRHSFNTIEVDGRIDIHIISSIYFKALVNFNSYVVASHPR